MGVALCHVAEAYNHLPAHRVSVPPTIDGVIKLDDEWIEVPSGKGFVDEELNSPSPYPTQFWLAYDDRFIYFAAKMDDSQASTVKAVEYRTNVSLSGEDTVQLAIDPFGTLSDFNYFSMNALGGTSIKIAGGRAAKREWLGEIVSKGHITASGWEVEARIPWNIMRLPKQGKRDVRINVKRYVSHNQREYAWCYTGFDINAVGVWQDVDLPRPDARRSLLFLPFGYLGAIEGGRPIVDGGLDLKASPTDQISLIGSIKPDFRNIEDQILSLDFSYFEKLASDSRPFFQEGADYFQLGGDQKIFVSQRIRNFDIGVKAYGKIGDKVTFGFLNTTTLGKSNASVASVTYKPDGATSIKLAGTSLADDGVDNQACWLAIDRRFGPVAWYAQHMASFDGKRGEGSRTNSGVFYNDKGWEAYGEYVEVTGDFYPLLGYSPERGFRGVNGSVGYSKTTSRWGLSEAGFRISGLTYDRFDGSLYRNSIGVSTSTTWRDGTDLDLQAQVRRFNGFEDATYTFDIEKPRRDPYRHYDFRCTFGRIQGHDYTSISAGLAYRPLQRLQVNAYQQFVEHIGSSEQTVVSANWDISDEDSIATRMVEENGDFNAYLAFKRTGNLGNEYFVILGDPNARSFKMSLILKASFPFEWKF